MPDGTLISDPYLRLAEVEREVGLGRSTIYRRISAGTFPAPRQLGGGCVRWTTSQIQAWKDGHATGVVTIPPPSLESSGRVAPSVRRRAG
ncbi:helix-turn-helix transcriptional regulator [Roseomonas elaeocarpi]|uniref:Helix-turn-helix transcriptional regulator n=1 Tax=Roseomonas elaeocarpi TaxID=907779 RepID=A0ABV6JTB6_9PROT